MTKATKVVLYFDDGTTFDIPADEASSIFLKQSAAVGCGHNPPYGKPPRPPKQPTSTVGAMAATMTEEADTSTSGSATIMAGTCYLINGVVVCP